MALSRHQEHVYTHSCNVWRRAVSTLTQGGHKEITGSSGYVLVASAVPCHFEIGKGMSVPRQGAGRVDYDIMVTSDEVHFGVDADVQNNDVVKMTAPGHPANGLFFTFLGEPQRLGQLGRRYPGRKTMMAARLPEAPQGVS